MLDTPRSHLCPAAAGPRNEIQSTIPTQERRQEFHAMARLGSVRELARYAARRGGGEGASGSSLRNCTTSSSSKKTYDKYPNPPETPKQVSPEELEEFSSFRAIGGMGVAAFGAVALAAIGAVGAFQMASALAKEAGHTLGDKEKVPPPADRASR